MNTPINIPESSTRGESPAIPLPFVGRAAQALLLISVIAGMAQPAQAQRYRAIDITPSGFPTASAIGVSDGKAVGFATDANGLKHAFLWNFVPPSPTNPTPVPTPQNITPMGVPISETVATAVSNGVVVGFGNRNTHRGNVLRR